MRYIEANTSDTGSIDSFFNCVAALTHEARKIRRVASAMAELGMSRAESLFETADSIDMAGSKMRDAFCARIAAHSNSVNQGSSNMLAAMMAGLEIGARK